MRGDVSGEKPLWVRRSIQFAARIKPIRRVLFEHYSKELMHVAPIHPLDKQYGIKTSGFLPQSVLQLGNKTDTANIGYLGMQPSILRRVLNTLPHGNDVTFLDLGCGKARALVVASEFPFRSLIGVELSPELARIASENVQVMTRKFPERTPITIVNTNALDYVLPEGPLIIFLYNPFGEDVVTSLLAKIETALKDDRSIWVVYSNPVCGHIFDTSSALSRIYADSIPYDSDEIGSGPDASEVVIIWQDAKSASVKVPKGAGRAVTVTNFGWRAELVD
jgi:SAM-dependent methyltransferase